MSNKATPARYAFTSAPESYDYGHTHTVAKAVATVKGRVEHTLRLILIAPEDRLDHFADYQLARYGSGLYYSLDVDKFWELHEYDMLRDVTEEWLPDRSEAETEVPLCPEWWLMDDGTMDTVVEVQCPICRACYEVRYAEAPRREDGAIIGSEMTEQIRDDWRASDGSECRCGEEN